MKITIANTYKDMSAQALQCVLHQMQARQQPLLCPASGDTPTGLYRQLVQAVKNKEAIVDQWKFISLDEWINMNGNDEGSCRYYLDQQLFSPLQVDDKKVCFFDGRATDLVAECNKAEDFIKAGGGIDVAIVGLGMNGHIGMNEPGTLPTTSTHIADIALTTQNIGQKYFKQKKILTKGITLGLATLLQARHIVLIVSGKAKANIVQQILERPPSVQLPASLLRQHSGLHIFLDKEAASSLTNHQ